MKKLIAFILLSHFNLWAQEVTIAGKVFGENNESLPGAVIEIKETNQKFSTDFDGFFSFKIPKGKYQLKVSYIGYHTSTIKITAFKNIFVNFQLKPKKEELSPVIIYAIKADDKMPVTQTNISRQKIEEENLGQDVPYLLELTPGVVATSDAGTGIGYTGIRIRGISPQQINVTLNGVPLNDPESHSVYWVDIPDFTGNTETIQIQRGVGTSTFGSGAFGASINLETQNVSQQPYTKIEATTGSFNTLKTAVKASTGLLNNHFEFAGRYTIIQSDGYVDRAFSNLKSYYLSGTYQDQKNTLKAITFGGFEKTYQAWYGVDKQTFENNPTFNYAGAKYDNNWNVIGFYDNQIDHYQQDHYQLHYKRVLGENFFVNISTHYTYGRGYYEQYKQDENFSDYGFTPYSLNGQHIEQTDLIRRKWLDNDFYGIITSVNYKSEYSKLIIGIAANQYDGRHFGRVIWTDKAVDTPYKKEYYHNLGVKKTWNGFAKYTYNITERFSLFTDIQFRNISYKINGDINWGEYFTLNDKLFFINPKLGIYYQYNLHNDFYLSVAQTHREPNRDDYINNYPETPKDETLNDFEGGWKHQQNRFKSEINIYAMFYKNQLVLTGKLDNVGSPIRENVGKSYRIGTEIQTNYIISKMFQISANISLSDNRNINYKANNNNVIKEYGNTQLTYSPSVMGAGIITFKPIENLKLKLTGKYVGNQYMDNRNIDTSKLDAYWISNLWARYSIKPKKTINSIDLTFKLNNIFNKKYASNGYMWGDTPYYYPQAGIHFLTGLEISF